MNIGGKASPRLLWVDTAKAIAIILVVLFHAVIFMEDIGLAGKWPRVVEQLETFRMPLFFFTAGLFAIGWQRKSYRQLFTSRVLLFLYLYVLWSVARFVYFSFVPWVLDSGDAGSLPALLGIFAWPTGGLWFIYALAIFFSLLWAVKGVRPAYVLATATVLAVLFGAGVLQTGNEGWNKMCLHLIFFLAAAYGSRKFRAMAENVGWKHLAPTGLVYLALSAGVSVLSLHRVPGVRLSLSVVAVAFGVCLAVVLSRLPMFGWLRAVGSRTLPIYLLHYFVVGAAAALLVPLTGNSLVQGSTIFLPLALTVVSILLSLVVYSTTMKAPGLFTLPLKTVKDQPQLAERH